MYLRSEKGISNKKKALIRFLRISAFLSRKSCENRTAYNRNINDAILK